MSTRVHDPVNPLIGELVSLMRSRKHPYGNVTAVIDEAYGKLTLTPRAKVSVNCTEYFNGIDTIYLGVWVFRDDIGSLIEVPEPVCIHCEETIECKCYPETV